MRLNCLNKFYLILIVISVWSNKIRSQIAFDKIYDRPSYITSIIEFGHKYVVAYPFGNNDIPLLLLDTNGYLIKEHLISYPNGIEFIDKGEISNGLLTYCGRTNVKDPLNNNDVVIAGYYVSLDTNFNVVQQLSIIPDSMRINNFWDVAEDKEGLKYASNRIAFRNSSKAYNSMEILNSDGTLRCINIDKSYKSHYPTSTCLLTSDKVLIGTIKDSAINLTTGESYQKYLLCVYDSNCNFVDEKTFSDSLIRFGNYAEVLDMKVISDKRIFIAGAKKLFMIDTLLNLTWEFNSRGGSKVIELNNRQLILASGDRILSFDLNGKFIWSKDFRNSYLGDEYEMVDINPTTDGGFILGINENNKLRVVKIAGNSDLIKQQSIQNSNNIELKTNMVANYIELNYNQNFNGKLTITDAIGRTLINQIITSKHQDIIDVTFLPNAIYYLVIHSDKGGKIFFKFLKQ